MKKEEVKEEIPLPPPVAEIKELEYKLANSQLNTIFSFGDDQ